MSKDITINLKNVNVRNSIIDVIFPPNDSGLSNSSILKTTTNKPWAGLKANQEFKIAFDGTYVRSGGLTWSIEQLIDEIEQGLWEVVQ